MEVFMRALKALTGIFLILLFVSAAGAQETKGFDGTSRIGGSTTLLPVITGCSSRFMAHYKTWNKMDQVAIIEVIMRSCYLGARLRLLANYWDPGEV
jgi:hypothetical protein